MCSCAFARLGALKSMPSIAIWRSCARSGCEVVVSFKEELHWCADDNFVTMQSTTCRSSKVFLFGGMFDHHDRFNWRKAGSTQNKDMLLAYQGMWSSRINRTLWYFRSSNTPHLRRTGSFSAAAALECFWTRQVAMLRCRGYQWSDQASHNIRL